MSDEWQVGDLAVCVNTQPLHGVRYIGTAGKRLVLNKTYRVNGIFSQTPSGTNGRAPYLSLEGVSGTATHQRFRKIRPDAEPCEEEFVTLIKRMKPAKVTT